MENKLKALTIDYIKSKCPIANLDIKPGFTVEEKCPFHQLNHKNENSPDHGKECESGKSGLEKKATGSRLSTADLLASIGGGDLIRQMTTRFYAHAFEDQTLSKFMFEPDCAAAHGQRLGDWIIEKMGGEGEPWTDSGRLGMRQPSHYKAWNSCKRDKKDRGKHFKLDDCRIWMRLMFWSGREVGLSKHEPFWNWYVEFIGHFIGIYEYTAPAYARKDAKWSKDKRNMEQYRSDGFIMKDVAGIGRN